jgi:hypothetical protein
MLTPVAKMWAALFGGILSLLQFYFQINLGFITEDMIAFFINAVLLPFLVWATPNKSADTTQGA